MNRELKRVTMVALLMFLALFVSSTVIQNAQAENLAADPRFGEPLLSAAEIEDLVAYLARQKGPD